MSPSDSTTPAVGSLLYDEIDQELRAASRKLLTARSPAVSVLRRIETEPTTDRKLWRALTDELEVTGLAIDERFGGGGAGWREVGVIMEELGRAVAPVPYLGSAVIATSLAREVSAERLLSDLAGGRVTAALAVDFGAASFAPDPSATLRDCVLDAEVSGVADALLADVLLVAASTGEIVTVLTSDPGVTLTPVVSLDMTRQLADISIHGAAFEVVAERSDSEAALASTYLAACAMLACEQLGVAEWCLDATIGYLKERRQFGRVIGSYQALKHRCADLWVEISQARAVTRYAAGCVADGDPDSAVAAALAQAHCSLVAVRAAEECVQLHGGIGFTWEFAAHLYLKRARCDALALGSADVHRARLGELIELPSPAS